MALNVVSYTLGSSLFLTHVGSDRLPLFYLFIGSISILGYTWLAQVVDKFPRERLFRYVLLGGIALGLLLGLLNIPDSVVAYYVIFIIFAFQWNFHLDILFPSLVSDYFTTLEYKSYAPRLAIAQAVGGLLGGALTSWLAVKMATHNLLLVLPVFCAVAMGQISYLERSFTQLEGSVEEGVGNLRTFVLLVKSTPIVFFLASSTLVFFILYTFAQFQYFTIYAQVFPNDQQLTDFLGKIWILGNGVQLVVLSCFTQPLLPRLGVTRMNLVYPITTLASFIGLAVNFNLPSAIFAYVNNESLDQSINQPTHTLNYNAVPHSFVGRVRAIADGTFLGLGFILAGALLLPASSFLTPSQITWIGIGLCCGFGLLRYFQNKSYLQSLLSMLRSGSVNLDDCDSGLTFLPVAYNQEVAQLLASKERDNRILGLELAARLQNPKVMFPEILALLPEADYEVRGALIKLIVSNRARETLLPQLQQEIENLLAGDNPREQAIALEVAIATGKKLDRGEDMGGGAGSDSSS